MQRGFRKLSRAAALGLLVAAFAIGPFRLPDVQASSHREAPLISMDPFADNTDVYMFVSPDRPNTVTVIADYIPLEEPSNGPDFYRFDDNALYQVRFDNNGDARVDVIFEFRFNTVISNPDTFLYNTNVIDNLSDPDWVVKQFMSVTARVRQGDPNNPQFTTFNLGSNLPTPPVNVGPRSTPNYETNYAEPSISTVQTNAGDIKLFAGQRDDPFFIDTGSIFDLFGLRPFNAAHAAPRNPSNGVDGLAGYNVHAIAMQVPISLLTASGTTPTNPSDPNAIIGVYATASRPSTRVLNTNGTQTQTGNCANGQGVPGADPTCVQVSRLANPLFNEVLVPRGSSTTASENDKDLYNSQLPATDINRIEYVRGVSRPVEPVTLINLLYPPTLDVPANNRNDLVRVFLTGVPGATRPPVQNDPADPGAGPGAVPSDLLRLNVAVPPTPFGQQNRLGFIAGDNAGFPNGRRPADDVVDIELRVLAGVLLPGNACYGSAPTPCNQAPNNQLGDGVNENDRPFRTTFPYLASPVSGYENPYHGRTASPDTVNPGPAPAPPRP